MRDFHSARFLRLRDCPACGGRYFEGGTTRALVLIGAVAAVAIALKEREIAPPWMVGVMMLGGSLLGMLNSYRCAPEKGERLRRKLVQAVLAGPVAFTLVSVPIRFLP